MALRFRRSRPIFSATTAFAALLLVRLFSAAYATIPDCDEVFNFWEPTHYLSHGYGLQTWEYSPVYAIRSWAYVGLHAVLSRVFSELPNLSKVHEFYGLRCLLAVFCAFCETRLYTAVSTNINRRVGILYLITTITSAGMFHAATAFLPSTFAMYTTMLGTAAFIDRRRGFRTAEGVFWFALGGLLGWPFSMAMCIPHIAEELFMAAVSWGAVPTFVRLVKGGIAALALLAGIVAVDYYAYRKLEIVPLNIVLYNVFSGPGKGPDIYGTEPWWFYLANLTLNFNVLLPLALISAPCLILYYIVCRSSLAPGFTPRMISLSMPFYLWFAIFTAQPHKEERFMYVAYPALCLNAAMAYHVILTVWGSVSNRLTSGKSQDLLNWTVLALPLAVAALGSLSRVLAVVSAYSAPLEVYSGLPANATGNLCLAKEWYRFPSSYFLPDGMRARFVKSAFDGLLPGEFPESKDWPRPGTWMIPEGMNDENKGDPSKYIKIDDCNYLVESYFDRGNSSQFEPDYQVDMKQWEEVECKDFLDSARTPTLGRILWAPKWIPSFRAWGKYCLLKRKS
ncbi:Alg9-like mannosyltransferase family-domain-containing protein [Sphaerosporella brunnea]|uniref:Mannosyltransferase n=1 Tax=Sphaerosporella brunnea TaxID=1250544 RepID=A0A5J5FBY5_9PEZI|nr:Alg9-like mannosyltransferase family-domain-containing protein [Sphaerosporella brunnea]